MTTTARQLGSLEQYSAARHVLGMMPMVVVSATYSVPITKRNLYPALANLIEDHTLLGCNIFEEYDTSNKRLYIVKQLDTIELDDVVQFLPSEPLSQFVNNVAFNTVIPYNDPSRPYWRVYVLGNHEVVFGFDHGMFDGNSGRMFHQELLDRMRSTSNPGRRLSSLSPKTSSSSPCPTAVCPSPHYLPPCLEDVVSIRPPVTTVIKKVVGDMLFGSSSAWTGPPAFVPYSSKTVFFSITGDSLLTLKRRCKQFNVSLTCMLFGALTMSILPEIPSEYNSSTGVGTAITSGKGKPTTIKFTCPINARRFLPEPECNIKFGNYVHTLDYSLNIAPRTSYSYRSEQELVIEWAQRFQQSLTDTLSYPQSMAHYTGMLQYVNVEDYLKGKVSQPRGNLAEVSNLGVVYIPRADNDQHNGSEEDDDDSEDDNEYTRGATITRMAFAQASSSLGAPYILNAVSVDGGDLTLSLSVAGDNAQCSTAIAIRDRLLDVLSVI